MQCSCGGEAVTTSSVRKNLDARLEYHECRACGRVGGALLMIGDLCVRTDTGKRPAAREAYAALTEESAEELVRETQMPPVPVQIQDDQQATWVF